MLHPFCILGQNISHVISNCKRHKEHNVDFHITKASKNVYVPKIMVQSVVEESICISQEQPLVNELALDLQDTPIVESYSSTSFSHCWSANL